MTAGLMPRWECSSLSSFTSCLLLSLLLSLCCLPSLITSCHPPPGLPSGCPQHRCALGSRLMERDVTLHLGMILKDSLRLPWGAQWLGPGAPTAGARVPSLLGELLIRSCKPGGKRKEKKKLTAFSNCVCDLKKEHVHGNI